jgi:long-chain acyl-CoA synthetase
MQADKTRLFDFYDYQLANHPLQDSLAAKVNGKWETYSTQRVIELANSLSTGLLTQGINPGDKVAIIANNRPEWVIADLAILQIGAINVPIYPTITEADYTFIFNDSGVKIALVSDQELYRKVSNVQPNTPALKGIYTFDHLSGAPHWSTLCTPADIQRIQTLRDAVKPADLATLIYTSGTTGTPKGVMLSHKNVASNTIACRERLPVSAHSRGVSFLPLCHIYERMILYLYVYTGVSLYFAQSMETIGDDIRDVKPQVFTAVPRLLEKVYDKIMAKGAELTGVKKALFFWAVGLAEKYEPYGQNGPFYEMKLKVARKLIFSKWQEALGGNVLAVASGSAALNPRLARIFNSAGIPVLEGYGLTETAPVISVNCLHNNGLRIGTTGRPIQDVHVKIAADGEILVKGPNVMMGYYNRPDLTAEVIDADSWFHTGDIGELVDGQFLKITDRKKEIFKTSGGKYVAPQIMENKFKESRFIEQIMVIGENRKHPAALVVPAFEFLKQWCEQKGIAWASREDVLKNPTVIERFQREIDEKNEHFGQWEKIKKFELLPNEFTIDGGEITPTLKLKRKEILKKYAALVEKIYAE